MSLEQELSGVIAEGIAAPDDIETDSDAAQAADDVAGNQDDQPSDDAAGSPDGGAAGRTIENVRRELLRKQTEEARRTRQEIALLGDLVKTMLGAAQGGPKPASPKDYSLEELKAFRAQVPPEQKEALEALITEKLVAENVKAQFNQINTADKYQKERDQANKRAVDHYPQLTNPYSPLYLEVNRRLVALDENHRKYNPRIVLNLAEEVAGEMGIAPRQINRPRNVTQPASVNGKKPVKDTAAESVIPSEERFEELARKLGGGKVKFDEAARKRIKERGVLYKAAGNQE